MGGTKRWGGSNVAMSVAIRSDFNLPIGIATVGLAVSGAGNLGVGFPLTAAGLALAFQATRVVFEFDDEVRRLGRSLFRRIREKVQGMAWFVVPVGCTGSGRSTCTRNSFNVCLTKAALLVVVVVVDVTIVVHVRRTRYYAAFAVCSCLTFVCRRRDREVVVVFLFFFTP